MLPAGAGCPGAPLLAGQAGLPVGRVSCCYLWNTGDSALQCADPLTGHLGPCRPRCADPCPCARPGTFSGSSQAPWLAGEVGLTDLSPGPVPFPPISAALFAGSTWLPLREDRPLLLGPATCQPWLTRHSPFPHDAAPGRPQGLHRLLQKRQPRLGRVSRHPLGPSQHRNPHYPAPGGLPGLSPRPAPATLATGEQSRQGRRRFHRGVTAGTAWVIGVLWPRALRGPSRPVSRPCPAGFALSPFRMDPPPTGLDLVKLARLGSSSELLSGSKLPPAPETSHFAAEPLSALLGGLGGGQRLGPGR